MTRFPRIAGRLLPGTLLSLALGVAALPAAAAEWFDTVIANGRVIDPESGLDAVRNVGIRGGVIRAVTTDKLEGHDVIDASGLVVSPGFIDLHWHGTRPASHRFQAKDGVTASFELEVGVFLFVVG